jgi:hypothetical protein
MVTITLLYFLGMPMFVGQVKAKGRKVNVEIGCRIRYLVVFPEEREM